MSKNDDSAAILFVIAVIIILGVGYGVYTVLKGWADALGLDVHSVFCLVFGTVLVVVLGVASWLRDWRPRAVIPWLVLPLWSLFWLPALNYWATPQMSSFGRYGEDAEIQWFGNGWWQAVGFLVLCGLAYAWMRWWDDDW